MPAKIAKRKGKFRIVEKDGKLMRNDSGAPIDGGGFASEAQAKKQMQAVNISYARKRGANIPKPKATYK